MALRRFSLLLLAGVFAACRFPGFTVASDEPPPPDDGEAGAPSVTPPNPCLLEPCQHDGQCVQALDGGFVCLCEPGFRGDTCELTFDRCEPDPCRNGGTCIEAEGSSYCQCQEGWDGATCEHDRDDCTPNRCLNGGTCVDGFKTYTCNCQPGFVGPDCGESLLPTCAAILETSPDSESGVYAVDPDGPGHGNLPLEVRCDMTSMDGGWTLVGQEREGDTGTFKFLGVSLGDPSRAARDGDSALFGEQFQGSYDEMRIGWAGSTSGMGAMYFRVAEEVFSDSVRTAMPISSFVTTDAAFTGWVSSAGGAVFCRASASPDVRPGDTSWAIRPKDDTATECGCNGNGWLGRGGFYGGHLDSTYCGGWGGGFSGVTDNKVQKGGIKKFGLQVWIR